MSAMILLPDKKTAVIGDDGVWQCADEPLRQLLNDQFPQTDRGGSDPNAPLSLAQEVVAQLGGTVEASDQTEDDQETVY